MSRELAGLLISGIVLMVAGFVLVAVAAMRGAESGGFVVVIGPLPIVGAWGPHGVALAAIGAILLLLLVLIHLLLLRPRP